MCEVLYYDLLKLLRWHWWSPTCGRGVVHEEVPSKLQIFPMRKNKENKAKNRILLQMGWWSLWRRKLHIRNLR